MDRLYRRWTLELREGAAGTVLEWEDRLVMSAGTYVLAVDGETGRVLWRSGLRKEVIGLARIGDRLYAAVTWNSERSGIVVLDRDGSVHTMKALHVRLRSDEFWQIGDHLVATTPNYVWTLTPELELVESCNFSYTWIVRRADRFWFASSKPRGSAPVSAATASGAVRRPNCLFIAESLDQVPQLVCEREPSPYLGFDGTTVLLDFPSPGAPSQVAAYDLATRRMLWEVSASRWAHVALDRGVAVIGLEAGGRGGVEARRVSDGCPLWSASTLSPCAPEVLVGGGVAFVGGGDEQGQLAYDLEHGELIGVAPKHPKSVPEAYTAFGFLNAGRCVEMFAVRS